MQTEPAIPLRCCEGRSRCARDEWLAGAAYGIIPAKIARQL